MPPHWPAISLHASGRVPNLPRIARTPSRLLRCLLAVVGQVPELDVTDDRLATIPAALSDDRRWAAFEAMLTGQLVRVYDLATERVRLDMTTTPPALSTACPSLCAFAPSWMASSAAA